MGSFLASQIKLEKMHAQNRAKQKWLFGMRPGGLSCLKSSSSEQQQLLMISRPDCLSHCLVSFLPIKAKHRSRKHRGRAGFFFIFMFVFIFFLSFFSFFLIMVGTCEFAPLLPSLVWKPQYAHACSSGPHTGKGKTFPQVFQSL